LTGWRGAKVWERVALIVLVAQSWAADMEVAPTAERELVLAVEEACLLVLMVMVSVVLAEEASVLVLLVEEAKRSVLRVAVEILGMVVTSVAHSVVVRREVSLAVVREAAVAVMALAGWGMAVAVDVASVRWVMASKAVGNTEAMVAG